LSSSEHGKGRRGNVRGQCKIYSRCIYLSFSLYLLELVPNDRCASGPPGKNKARSRSITRSFCPHPNNIHDTSIHVNILFKHRGDTSTNLNSPLNDYILVVGP
jgi:hypothetical protein